MCGEAYAIRKASRVQVLSEVHASRGQRLMQMHVPAGVGRWWDGMDDVQARGSMVRTMLKALCRAMTLKAELSTPELTTSLGGC